MTGKHEQALADVREKARAFAVEWATWTGSQDDYTRRLGVFLRRPEITVPEGIQDVTAASISSQTGDGNKYRVRVLLHTRRLTPLSQTEAQALPQVLVPVSREDLSRLKQDGLTFSKDKTVPAWRNFLMGVEVPVRIREDGQPEIMGLPVVISSETGEGEVAGPNFSDSPPPEFASFIKQFLGLYYGGGSLANFLAPGARIKPVADWKLESVGEIRLDNGKLPTRAYVRATVSGPGAGRLEQRIYLLVQPERGSYLVKDISAAE
ncbi:MAG: conjugal transfer protein, partial [Bacillota bacterium]